MSATQDVVATVVGRFGGTTGYTAPIVRREADRTEIEYDFISASCRGYEVITLEWTDMGELRAYCRCDVLEVPAHLTKLFAEELARLVQHAP